MPQIVVSASDATALAHRLLRANGVPDADATTIAECLVRADLRGVDSHGLTRLPGYLDRVRRGLVEPHVELAPVRVARAAAELDGRNGFGFVVATRAMNEAMDLARDVGVGVVSARRSTHFGMAACYALQAAEAGFIALI